MAFVVGLALGACGGQEMEGLDEESDSDDEPPPPLEPVGAHLRRQAKEEVAKEPEVDEMEDEVFNAKVENMISVRRAAVAFASHEPRS